jgi:hypothetical protein
MDGAPIHALFRWGTDCRDPVVDASGARDLPAETASVIVSVRKK